MTRRTADLFQPVSMGYGASPTCESDPPRLAWPSCQLVCDASAASDSSLCNATGGFTPGRLQYSGGILDKGVWCFLFGSGPMGSTHPTSAKE